MLLALPSPLRVASWCVAQIEATRGEAEWKVPV